MLVRLHSECLTGDVFYSKRCDCGEQLEESMKAIAHEKRGLIVYMRQEGRGIGLLNKIKAYALQDQGLDTVEANQELGFPADMRTYLVGANMLADFNVKHVKLLTNNPQKVIDLEKYGIKVIERVPLVVKHSKENQYYLKVKQEKLGHFLEID